MRFTRWHVGLWFKRLGIVMFVGLPAQYMWSRQQPPGAVPPWGYVWLLVGGIVLWCGGAIIQSSKPRGDGRSGNT